MSITETELNTNQINYPMLTETEDRVAIAKSLFGVLSNDLTLEDAKEERESTK